MFRRHGDAYRRTHDGHLGRVERRVMSSVELCRTAALGGHPRPVPIAASCAAPTTPAAPALPEVPEGGARRVAGRPLGFIPVLGYVDDLTPCRSGSLSLFALSHRTSSMISGGGWSRRLWCRIASSPPRWDHSVIWLRS